MCCELAELNPRIFEEDPEREHAHPGHSDTVPAQLAVNATVGVFFHELGHAVIALYDLPITGREEDVADNLKCWIYGSDPAGHADMVADGSPRTKSESRRE